MRITKRSDFTSSHSFWNKITAITLLLVHYIFALIEDSTTSNLTSNEKLTKLSLRKVSEHIRNALVSTTSDVAASVPLVAALAVAGILALSLTRSICSDSLYALATLAFFVHLISQPYLLNSLNSDR